VEAVDVGQEEARLRHQFADRVESLDETIWVSPSWCAGWQMRDVLAHLVRNAESTPWALTGDKAVMRLRHVSVPQLCGRLRRAADERVHSRKSHSVFGLGDVLVHSADAFRPRGQDVDVSSIVAASVLDAYWPKARIVVHAAPHRGRHLVATDIEWSRGTGPEVRGRAMDLLLLVANRLQVLPCLEGPGIAGLQIEK
jgi:uncharacterized protein (TIGR03083 family)